MGYGAYMSVLNGYWSADGNDWIKTSVSNVQCMHDNGEEGSNLQVFNGVSIRSGTTFPNDPGQYIEANGSGGCAFDSSKFTVTVERGDGMKLGTVDFEESDDAYEVTSDAVPLFEVHIDNQANQATIQLEVVNSPDDGNP